MFSATQGSHGKSVLINYPSHGLTADQPDDSDAEIKPGYGNVGDSVTASEEGTLSQTLH